MTSGPAHANAVALTFDDGPDPQFTPGVLDRLRALGIRATFFVVGAKAEAHPGLISRIASEGHEIGHHSWSHTPPGNTSAAILVSEARRTAALLQGLVGRRPCLFRPPYGKVTPTKLLGLWAIDQTVVLWNRDPKDFSSASVEPIRHWLETEPIAGGDILLFHDVHSRAAPVLDLLAERVDRLRLTFVTPMEWRDG
jgi:peptidoglycan/xylan/chitin deacetylase (PgdA/CDA1 family)